MSILKSIHYRKSQPVIDGEIPENDLMGILRCALTAPDHKALRPWKYIICRPQDKARLKKIIFDASVQLIQTHTVEKNSMDELAENELNGIEAKIDKKLNCAPYIIICVLNVRTDTPVCEIEQVLSAGAAVQNMVIAAEATGYACFWRTGDWAYNPFLKKALGLGDEAKITGFLNLGKMQTQKQVDAPERPAFSDYFSYL